MWLLNIHIATVALYPSLYESNQIAWLQMKMEGEGFSFHIQITEEF